jgi:hypothetical protein
MNQETIPDNNLPVYLQRYNVDILDDKKESVGKVLYTTVGAIPSNEKEKRVWQLNLTGYLKPNIETYHILYDFSEVDYKYKENISFENIISGTFNICGQVLDASKIIGFDYTYSDAESTLTIKLDTSKWNFRLKKEVLFSYQLNVDDDASTSTCPSSVSPSTYCTSITPLTVYKAINTSSTTTATLSTKSDNLLSYTDKFTINEGSTIITIYGIYMDIVKQSDSDSYFTISSLYVNSCTEGNISCSLYDVSYSDTSGNTVSGIIPSGFRDKYVKTTVTISTLNISLLFYVNSSLEYYFVGACPSSVSPSTYCTSIIPSDYTAINTSSNTSSTTTATLSTNSDNLLSYDYTTCQFNTFGFQGTVYSVYFVLESNGTTTYFTISSLYSLFCCNSGTDCNGTDCENAAAYVKYDNSNGKKIPGITIPSDDESAETVVSLEYEYDDIIVKETFATFYLTNNGENIKYYACMNTDFCISPSTSCSSSSS